MDAVNLTCFFLQTFWEKTSHDVTASIISCVLSSISSLVAIIGNGTIVLAIWKTRELHSPSFALLCCLAVSDLLVGLVAQPSFVAFKVERLLNNFNAYCNLRVSQFFFGWITCGVSFVCLSGISIDRLLALTLHLRYKTIVTVPRVMTLVISAWIAISIGTILKFWLGDKWLILPAITFSVNTLITAFCTCQIFLIARKHQRQIRQQIQAAIIVQECAVDVLKCKKSAVTVLCVFGLSMALYLPFLAVMLAETIYGVTWSVELGYDLATTVVFINSSVNPVIYCLRVTQIRRVVKSNFRKLNFWFNL